MNLLFYKLRWVSIKFILPETVWLYCAPSGIWTWVRATALTTQPPRPQFLVSIVAKTKYVIPIYVLMIFGKTINEIWSETEIIFLFSNGLQIEELVYSINYEENCGDLKSTFLFKLFIDLVKHFPWTQKLMLDHCVRPYKHKKWLSNLK